MPESPPACQEDHDHLKAWACVYFNGDVVLRPAAIQRDFERLMSSLEELNQWMAAGRHA
jgi:hypothetical protein